MHFSKKNERGGMPTEEDRKRDSKIALLLLATIYDGAKSICKIIENIIKTKKNNLIS